MDSCPPKSIDQSPKPQNFRMWPYLRQGLSRGNQVQRRSLGRALIQYELCPCKKRRFGQGHAQREDCVKDHREKVAISEPRRKAWSRAFPHSLRRNHPADALNFDSWPAERGGSTFLWLKSPSFWHFVKTAPTKDYTELLREQQMAKTNDKGSRWDQEFLLCYAFMP